ncbi:hypothetical protein OTU49_008264 [Cherax quadricarinatus]|uniref:Prolyl-tRNA synthetase n=1 Tax=Cherax quadricarinatus TaxID=27406 RepID=A0AAW0WCH2_CHEQU
MTKTLQVFKSRGLYKNLICNGRSHHFRVSELFQPLSVIPRNAKLKNLEDTSLSQKLLVNCGIINSRSNGMFALLPLGQRVIDKLTAIIDEEMRHIGAQKLLLPLLTSGHLWKKKRSLGINW